MDTKTKFLLATVGTAITFMALASATRAADVMPPAFKAKAVPYAPCQVASATTPLSCSGAYAGGGLGGQGSNADIIGSGVVGSVFAGGITPTGDIGYQYIQGNWIFGGELDVGYSVGTKAIVNGVGNGFNGFRITEDFKAGGNLSALLGSQAAITIPPSLANSVLGPYVHVGVTQWQLPGNAWANGVVSGAGVLFDISPRIFGDLRYTYTNFNAARAGGLTINDDNSIMALIDFKLN